MGFVLLLFFSIKKALWLMLEKRPKPVHTETNFIFLGFNTRVNCNICFIRKCYMSARLSSVASTLGCIIKFIFREIQRLRRRETSKIWNYAQPGFVFSSAILVDFGCHTDSLEKKSTVWPILSQRSAASTSQSLFSKVIAIWSVYNWDEIGQTV